MNNNNKKEVLAKNTQGVVVQNKIKKRKPKSKGIANTYTNARISRLSYLVVFFFSKHTHKPKEAKVWVSKIK